MNKGLHNSGLTAMKRRELSTPMRWLLHREPCLLRGEILDYGCGRGNDLALLRSWGMHAWGYDPNNPQFAGTTKSHTYPFDTVTCIFVLNTLPNEEERNKVIAEVMELTLPVTGKAYFAVRNDKVKLKGWTKRGTWQGMVSVPHGELLEQNASFRLYRLTNC